MYDKTYTLQGIHKIMMYEYDKYKNRNKNNNYVMTIKFK